MAIWVEIKDEEAYWYLRSLMRRAVERSELGAMLPEVAQHSQHLHDALVSATTDPKVPELPQEPMPAKQKQPRKPRAPRGSKKDLDPSYCKEHPKYGAKRKPREGNECEGCWAAFEKFNPLSPHVRKRKA